MILLAVAHTVVAMVVDTAVVMVMEVTAAKPAIAFNRYIFIVLSPQLLGWGDFSIKLNLLSFCLSNCQNLYQKSFL